jgi:hypothetical protein
MASPPRHAFGANQVPFEVTGYIGTVGRRERPVVAAQIQPAQHRDKGAKPAPFQLVERFVGAAPLPEVYFSRVDRTLRMEKLELIRSTPGRAERISLWIRSKAPALSTSTRSM